MNYRLSKGLHFQIRGRGEYVIEGRLPGGELQIKDINSNEYKSVKEESLIESLYDGDLDILGDEQDSTLTQRRAIRIMADELSLLSEDLRLQTKRRYFYIREIKEQKLTKLTKDALLPVIRKISVQLRDPAPPSWKTLGRWFKRYLASGENMRSLIPAYKLRGNRNRKFSGGDSEKSDATLKIIEKVIAERYLTRHRLTVDAIYHTVYARIASENHFRERTDQLSFPHKSSIYSIINKLDQYEVLKARFGKQIADQKYAATKQGPRPTRPLERIEMDHTKLDMLVVDLEMRLPVGRPWITVALDKYSRMILGIHIGFDPPGYLSVMQCLRHAINPKTYIKDRYPDIKNTWNAYGIPELIVVDNGPEFHSNHLEDACLQLGINVHYAPPKRGQYKGAVERFFRTQNQKLLHGQPGTTFSNIMDRADYDPKENAVISTEAFEKLTHIFIADVYHQTLHRELQNTPAQVWKAAIEEYPPALPARSADLNVLLGCIEARTISHVGIELHNLRYNDERLAYLRRSLKAGEKVQVKYDPSDLSLIHVADKDKGEYIPVPASNQSYTQNLTLWQHKLIRRYARMIGKDNTNMIDLCLAKEKLQEIVEQEWRLTKKTQTRQKLARFRNEGQHSSTDLPRSIEGRNITRLASHEPKHLPPLRAGTTLSNKINHKTGVIGSVDPNKASK
jgi:putative transposase